MTKILMLYFILGFLSQIFAKSAKPSPLLHHSIAESDLIFDVIDSGTLVLETFSPGDLKNSKDLLTLLSTPGDEVRIIEENKLHDLKIPHQKTVKYLDFLTGEIKELIRKDKVKIWLRKNEYYDPSEPASITNLYYRGFNVSFNLDFVPPARIHVGDLVDGLVLQNFQLDPGKGNPIEYIPTKTTTELLDLVKLNNFRLEISADDLAIDASMGLANNIRLYRLRNKSSESLVMKTKEPNHFFYPRISSDSLYGIWFKDTKVSFISPYKGGCGKIVRWTNQNTAIRHELNCYSSKSPTENDPKIKIIKKIYKAPSGFFPVEEGTLILARSGYLDWKEGSPIQTVKSELLKEFNLKEGDVIHYFEFSTKEAKSYKIGSEVKILLKRRISQEITGDEPYASFNLILEENKVKNPKIAQNPPDTVTGLAYVGTDNPFTPDSATLLTAKPRTPDMLEEKLITTYETDPKFRSSKFDENYYWSETEVGGRKFLFVKGNITENQGQFVHEMLIKNKENEYYTFTENWAKDVDPVSVDRSLNLMESMFGKWTSEGVFNILRVEEGCYSLYIFKEDFSADVYQLKCGREIGGC